MTQRRPKSTSAPAAIVLVAASGMAAALAPTVLAQSLFMQPAGSTPTPSNPASTLQGYSLILVQPPEPRKYQVHDLVTIIIEETSRSTSSESLDTEQESTSNGRINAMLDPMELLELRLRQGNLSNQALIGTNLSNDFQGEGDYERTDRLSTRITAEIIDVKPNGTLVLQARKRIEHNGEFQEYVLAGVCRQEDVTTANTVLSTQVANLTVTINNEGEVREAARKGWITRMFEGVFDF
ncbi:MAG: flagellar basal body L-ring protein FlgH [Phycisphaeraceae bacterium]|nr:flagellar basal body L-ring protein FlgH [Phycisphaeraceae bacterium]